MFGEMTFLIRTSGDPLNLVSQARRAVAEIEPDRSLANIQAMEAAFGGTVRDRGYYALVLGVFACTATLLAAIGTYALWRIPWLSAHAKSASAWRWGQALARFCTWLAGALCSSSGPVWLWGLPAP